MRGGPEAVMEDRDVSMVPRAKLVRVMARLVGFIKYMQYKYLMRTRFEVLALKAFKHFRIKLWEHYQISLVGGKNINDKNQGNL